MTGIGSMAETEDTGTEHLSVQDLFEMWLVVGKDGSARDGTPAIRVTPKTRQKVQVAAARGRSFHRAKLRTRRKARARQRRKRRGLA